MLASACALTSCGDFLNEEPALKQSNELTLSKYSGINNAGAALYSMMQSASWYDGQFILQSELRGGNAKNPLSLPGSGRYLNDTQWIYTENSTSAVWSYAYYTISWANNIINNVDNITDAPSQKDLDNLKAEALFMRALCHFDLVITYAQPYTYDKASLGVPVVLVTKNDTPARNTVEEVYDQVVADLLEAEKLMGDNFTRDGALDRAAMASKPAIQALLSRVYLYMGKWQESADYATKVINCGKYSIADADGYAEMFSSTVAPSGSEIILEVYGSKKNEYWDESGWTHLCYITDMNGSADICATSDVAELYEEGDVRATLFTKHESDYFCTKYSGKAGADPRESNVPIIRLSEMYLNRAEAIANGASVSGVTVAQDLMAITSKRGASEPKGTSAADVRLERRKELVFEGHIVYDLARSKTGLVRNDYDGGNAEVKNIPFPSYRWAMPIPKREMDANPNMVQNEGY